MFNSNVKAVLLYTFESWTITQRTLGKFQVFINKCIQKIANIHWPDRIYSNELWKIVKNQYKNSSEEENKIGLDTH